MNPPLEAEKAALTGRMASGKSTRAIRWVKNRNKVTPPWLRERLPAVGILRKISCWVRLLSCRPVECSKAIERASSLWKPLIEIFHSTWSTQKGRTWRCRRARRGCSILNSTTNCRELWSPNATAKTRSPTRILNGYKNTKCMMRSLGSRGLRSSSWAPRNGARPFAFSNGPSDKSRWA